MSAGFGTNHLELTTENLNVEHAAKQGKVFAEVVDAFLLFFGEIDKLKTIHKAGSAPDDRRHTLFGHGRQVYLFSNEQMIRGGRRHAAFTHFKRHRRVGTPILQPNLDGLAEAMPGVASALDATRRPAAVARLTVCDFSLGR